MECAIQNHSAGRNAPPRPPPPNPMSVNSRINGCSTSADSAISFHHFQHIHDKAFEIVSKGLSSEEEEDITVAEQLYTESLKLLDKVLDVDCEHLQNASQEQKDSAKQMQQKMTKTRLQVSYHLEAIRMRGQQQTSLLEQTTQFSEVRLPSYEEATSPSSSSYMLLGDSILDDECESSTQSQMLLANGRQLFSIPDGVQIFFISPEGYVSAPSYPSSLKIIKLVEQPENVPAMQRAPAFLQVADWIYPLVPNTSPILHTSYGAYIFPDLSSEVSGSSVGLMIPETVNQENRQLLEDIIRNYSAVQEQVTALHPEDLVIPTAPIAESEPAPCIPETSESSIGEVQPRKGSTASKISKGILIASEWISWGLGKGAEKAEELIKLGSAKLRENIKPEETPKPVDPRIQKGMVFARKATHSAVRVSSFIVHKLGEVTVALGRTVAPHIREQGGKLLPKSLKGEESSAAFEGVIEVATSGLQGFGTVYMSLEHASKALARSLANETVNIVQHKYGEHAGLLTENTLFAAGNVAMTAHNADNLGIKAIAKRTAKATGKAVLHDIKEVHKSQQLDENSQDRKGINDKDKMPL